MRSRLSSIRASALVKRYADEDGAEILADVDVLVASGLAGVEIASALHRLQRAGRLPDDEGRGFKTAVVNDFRGDGDTIVVLAVTEDVLDRAAELAGRHALRAGDAIQLASAVVNREASPECDTVLCFDPRLAAAAVAAGFHVLPEQGPNP